MVGATTPPRLVTLILLTALTVLTLNMFLPSLPGIAEAFGADYALVSLALGGYLAVTAVVQLVIGPLSDRIGRRPVLIGALGLFVIGSFGAALAGDVWTFLAFRMLQAGMIAGTVMSMAIVRDTTPEREAASRIGYIATAMAAAPMLGPMLGGVLDAAFGWRANFWLYVVGGCVMLALVWVDLGETRPERPPKPDPADTLRALLRVGRFWAYVLCTASARGSFYIFIAGAPLVATTVFDVSPAALGFYIGCITMGFMGGSFIAGRYAARVRPATMMISGRVIAIAALLAGLGLLAAGVLSAPIYFASAVLVGFGNGISIPSATSAAMSIRPRLAGSAAGVEGALTVGGGAVLTTLTAVVLTSGDAPAQLLLLMLAACVVGLVSVLVALRMEQRTRTDVA